MDTASYSTNANAYSSFPAPQDRLSSRGPPPGQRQPPENCGQSCMTSFGQNLANCHMPAGFPTQQPQTTGYGQNFAAVYAPGAASLTVASHGDFQSLERKLEQGLDNNLHQVSECLSHATEHYRNLEASLSCFLHDIVAKTRTAVKLGLDSNERTLKDCLDAKKFVFEPGCEKRVHFMEKQLASLKDGHHALLRTMEQVTGRVAAAQEAMQRMEQKTDTMSGAVMETLKQLQASTATKDDLIKYADEIFEKQQAIHDKRDEDTTRFRADVSQSLATLKESVVTLHSLAQNNAYSSEATVQALQNLEGCKKGKEVIPEALHKIHDSVLAMQGLTRTNANANEASVQRLERMVAGVERGSGYTNELLKEFMSEVKNALDNIASLVGTFSSRVNIVGPTTMTRSMTRKRPRNSR